MNGENGFNSFLRGVYAWMFYGLLLTAVVAYIIISSDYLLGVFSGSLVFYALLIAELIVVIILSARIRNMSPATAKLIFSFYAVLNGTTFAVIFLAYTGSSIVFVFLGTALLFGIMSIYGYTTKRDLSGIGHFAFMALIGLIVVSIIDIFFASQALDWITSWAGVIIFTALTAYDTQKISRLYDNLEQGEGEQSASILGALTLYLDFINLFIDLLRIFGRRRSD